VCGVVPDDLPLSIPTQWGSVKKREEEGILWNLDKPRGPKTPPFLKSKRGTCVKIQKKKKKEKKTF